MSVPPLVATCWTSAGAVMPMDQPELSPHSALERLTAIAITGWSGFGFSQDDLRQVEATIGFAAVRTAADQLGLTHIEVEIAGGWWGPDDRLWRPTWELLLRAAKALNAKFIKVGTAFGEPLKDIAPLVGPMRCIAEEAHAVGTTIALEPLPFAMIASMPQGADLIRAVDHPAAGLVVDYWHVFRANTSLDELAERVPVEMVFGVELSDAQHETVGTLFEDTRDRRTLLTEGAQDVPGFIRTIREMGYTGAWGVEILSAEHRARSLENGLALAHESAVRAFEMADRPINATISSPT
ncbi:sugar phosphate isomerase/epimerase [Microcella alkaliphila]|uniref:Sugar phosphate isomerase/epimerase n=1 Tax=Microcella alkaliphila TaxID=279828 RepID=A0A4Q7U1U8_9MICO|nr:sugar phosphate isomerase/epimerase family protein [Microcella alkaliphila]RZT66478.1 sugar phosphate isomerase/epimerase [Microcella alkaliphila]